MITYERNQFLHIKSARDPDGDGDGDGDEDDDEDEDEIEFRFQINNDKTSCYYLKHLEDLEICLYNDFTSEKDQIYQFCSEHIYLLAFPYLMIMLVVNIYYLY